MYFYVYMVLTNENNASYDEDTVQQKAECFRPEMKPVFTELNQWLKHTALLMNVRRFIEGKTLILISDTSDYVINITNII